MSHFYGIWLIAFVAIEPLLAALFYFLRGSKAK